MSEVVRTNHTGGPWAGFGHALRDLLGVLAAGMSGMWNKRPVAVARRTAQRISFLTHCENAQAVMERPNEE